MQLLGLLPADPGGLDQVKRADEATAKAEPAGASDRVNEQGIDEWRGGVHLKAAPGGKGPTWRWDTAAKKLVER